MPFECNLHITLTPFKTETRLLKQTNSLIKSGVVNKVHISALFEEGLQEYEKLDENRHVRRHRFIIRLFPKNVITHLIAYLELIFQVLRLSVSEKVDLVNVHTLALLPVGYLVKVFTGAKFVYDTHELETEIEGPSRR
jgi:hypothetical protein